MRLIVRLAVIFISARVAAHAAAHTNVHTIFIVLMENVSWPDIKGSTNAPYINNVLLPASSYCDNFYIAPNTFGSLPQYLWLEAGTNFGINDSNDPALHHIASTNHLVIQLQNAGISWRAYMESISGATCPTASGGVYAAFHNPFVYFDDVYLNSTNCTNRIRPYTEFARDLTNNAVARYNFITPNLCHDMHGGAGCPSGNRIRLGDDWLATEIPRILSSQAYRNNGAIIITWDEGTANVAGPFGTIVMSQFAKGGGYRNTNRFDHASTLRTVQEIFGVRPFLYNASTAPSLEDLFNPVIELSIASTWTSGAFAFTINGLSANKTNVIQASDNLQTWTDVLTNVSTTNRLVFTDTNAGAAPRRFYRVVQPN